MDFWNSTTLLVVAVGALLVTVNADCSQIPDKQFTPKTTTTILRDYTITRGDEQFVKHQIFEFSMEWNPNVELSSACVCGNSVIDPGEECDDGNTLDGDGCQGNCLKPVCGDGIIDPGEECDDGNNLDWDGCHGNCRNQTQCYGAEMFFDGEISRMNQKPTGTPHVYFGKAVSFGVCMLECTKLQCQCKTLAYNKETKDCFIYNKTYSKMDYAPAPGFLIHKFIK